MLESIWGDERGYPSTFGSGSLGYEAFGATVTRGIRYSGYGAFRVAEIPCIEYISDGKNPEYLTLKMLRIPFLQSIPPQSGPGFTHRGNQHPLNIQRAVPGATLTISLAQETTSDRGFIRGGHGSLIAKLQKSVKSMKSRNIVFEAVNDGDDDAIKVASTWL